MQEVGLPPEMAEYRALQRSIPGVEGLYAATRAILAASISKGGTILIVGAAGGRELELLRDIRDDLRFIAVDTAQGKLSRTEEFLRERGLGKDIDYVPGSIDTISDREPSVGATSLLVMHSIPDDGSKLCYLKSIRARLQLGASIVLADVSFDEAGDFERTIPAFLEHAQHVGVSPHHSEVDPRVIPTMPIVGSRRIVDLLLQADFGEVTPFFRSFWYAGWWARAL